MDIREQINKLRKLIEEHNHKYYVLDKPTITDFEYDKLVDELTELESKYPQLFDVNSPTQNVGGQLMNSFESMNHDYPMLSLSNTYSNEELFDFEKRIKKLTDKKIEYVCELKFDGVSISLKYENGVLIRALTRGDGIKGDNVIENIKTIKSIPRKIFGNFPNLFEIRGEIFISKSSFIDLNLKREKEGKELFSNPRNTASGSIKILDVSEVAERPLDCFLFSLLGNDLPSESHIENLEYAKSWGFNTSSYSKKFSSIEDVIKYIKDLNQVRDTLPFEIDGVVVKVDNINLQNELGNTAKSPRWAIAYKFQAEQANTIVTNIDYQVGRTGAITPVANLKPVKLSGTIIKRASLHNYDQIIKLGVQIGSNVIIEKGGEIIPKVVRVTDSRNDLFSNTFNFIKNCPACGSVLQRKIGDAKHYCINRYNCGPQIKGAIEHYISRNAMNIDSIGKKTIDLFFDNNLVSNISDLYDLKIDQLLPFKKEGRKWAENIINGINESKKITFDKFLFSLGIRHVGQTMSKKLANCFKNIENLIGADIETLVEVDEIAETTAISIFDFFKEPRNIEIVNKLKYHGIQFEINETKDIQVSSLLSGKKIVVSGVFSDYSREDLKHIIKENGGESLSSISKKTSFVLSGDSMGPSKKEKALSLNIPIIGIDKFLNMIKK